MSKTDKVAISSHPVKCNLVMASRQWLRVSHVLFLPSMVFKFTFRNSEIQFKSNSSLVPFIAILLE